MKSGRFLPRRSGRKQKETWYGSTRMIWTLDDNDLRRLWQDVTPATGLTLRQAMLFHDEENRAERFHELDMQGYGGDPPPLVQIDGWPTPPEVLSDFRVNSRNWRDDKGRLEFCLLQKLITGKLVATGYAASDPLDEPARAIAADRWRTLVPDFETSNASGPGVTVGGILVFSTTENRQPQPTPRQPAHAKVRSWYKSWVDRHLAEGTQPSREMDEAAAREALGASVSRQRLRDLRRQLAPQSWRQSGRPKRSG